MAFFVLRQCFHAPRRLRFLHTFVFSDSTAGSVSCSEDRLIVESKNSVMGVHLEYCDFETRVNDITPRSFPPFFAHQWALVSSSRCFGLFPCRCGSCGEKAVHFKYKTKKRKKRNWKSRLFFCFYLKPPKNHRWTFFASWRTLIFPVARFSPKKPKKNPRMQRCSALS